MKHIANNESGEWSTNSDIPCKGSIVEFDVAESPTDTKKVGLLGYGGQLMFTVPGFFSFATFQVTRWRYAVSTNTSRC
jgi:hypothetical protein